MALGIDPSSQAACVAEAESNAQRPLSSASLGSTENLSGSPEKPVFSNVEYGWNEDTLLAWRKKTGDPDSMKEYSLPPVLDNKAEDTSLVEAEFLDGTFVTLASLSVGNLKKHLQARRSGGSSEPLATCRHHSTHNILTISQRVDRVLLISMYEQARQILQVNANWFGDVPGQDAGACIVDPKNQVIQDALTFMNRLMPKYANGEIKDKEDLKKARDMDLVKYGHGGPGKKKIIKKPAAAAASETETTPDETITKAKAKKKYAKKVNSKRTPSPTEEPPPGQPIATSSDSSDPDRFDTSSTSSSLYEAF